MATFWVVLDILEGKNRNNCETNRNFLTRKLSRVHSSIQHSEIWRSAINLIEDEKNKVKAVIVFKYLHKKKIVNKLKREEFISGLVSRQKKVIIATVNLNMDWFLLNDFDIDRMAVDSDRGEFIIGTGKY